MPELPLLSGKELVALLSKCGFVLKRVRGSHHILIHQDKQLTVSVPIHNNQKLGRGITLAIIKDAGLSKENAVQLLQ